MQRCALYPRRVSSRGQYQIATRGAFMRCSLLACGGFANKKFCSVPASMHIPVVCRTGYWTPHIQGVETTSLLLVRHPAVRFVSLCLLSDPARVWGLLKRAKYHVLLKLTGSPPALSPIEPDCQTACLLQRTTAGDIAELSARVPPDAGVLMKISSPNSMSGSPILGP